MINSIGAATWLSAIHAYGDIKLSFSKCPHAFTGLCLMLNDFTNGGRVESLYVRYRCDGCPRGNSLKTLLVQREVALKDGSSSRSAARSAVRRCFPRKTIKTCLTSFAGPAPPKACRRARRCAA